MKINVSVTHEYSGLADYWGGNGKRWTDNAGCLFAYYGATTSLRGCVDQWVDDFMGGGDCDSFHEDVTDGDIRAAILDSLTEQGRDDYKNGVLAECAVEYADANGLNECPYCGGECNDEGGCDGYEGDIDGLLEDREQFNESPIWVILVECELEIEDGEWVLSQYDNSSWLGEKAGKWIWTRGDVDETCWYDSEAEAFANDPRVCAECEECVGSSHYTGCGKRTVDCPTVVSDDCEGE